MRLSLIGLMMLASCATGFSQTSAYSQQIAGTNALAYPLNNYQGKKIMIVVLPASQTNLDSAFMARIDSLATNYPGQVKVFAVPSYEDGYTDSSATLMNWYQSALDTSITISKPLYTHIASGNMQDGLFSWLTHSSQNSQFDNEISGTKTMFFIDGAGSLFGIIEPDGAFSNKAMSKVLP